MAFYDFLCGKCDSSFELSKKISERDEVSTDSCPECSTVGQMTRQVGAPMVGYSVTTPGGYGRVPDGFKQVLRNIDKKSGVRKGNNTSSFL
jgi:putative FmdB family regulatory protein